MNTYVTPARIAPRTTYYDKTAPRAEPCPECDGRCRRRKPHTRTEERCPTCGGTGVVAGPEPLVEV